MGLGIGVGSVMSLSFEQIVSFLVKPIADSPTACNITSNAYLFARNSRPEVHGPGDTMNTNLGIWIHVRMGTDGKEKGGIRGREGSHAQASAPTKTTPRACLGLWVLTASRGAGERGREWQKRRAIQRKGRNEKPLVNVRPN